jgi:Zn-dependent alcohol dehydrogenase
MLCLRTSYVNYNVVLQLSNLCKALIMLPSLSSHVYSACMCFALQAWGRTIILGLDEMDKKLSFNPLEILQGRKLKYVAFGGFKNSDIPKLVDKYMNNVNSHSFVIPYHL